MFSRSFGAYDEAPFRYLAIPFIYLFGLNEFAARLPTALLGILSVWLLYRLGTTYFGQGLGLLCAFFLAINPWHIQMSRFSCRAILLPVMLSLALFFFLKIKENPKHLLLSALCFALGLHTYNAARVFIPLFMVAIVALYRRELWRQKGLSLGAALLFIAIFLPLFKFWISPAGMERATEVLNLEAAAILTAYWSYFDPQYLFFSGDPNLRHSIRHMGMLHHFEIVTVIAGILGAAPAEGQKARTVVGLAFALSAAGGFDRTQPRDPHHCWAAALCPVFGLWLGGHREHMQSRPALQRIRPVHWVSAGL